MKDRKEVFTNSRRPTLFSLGMFLCTVVKYSVFIPFIKCFDTIYQIDKINKIQIKLFIFLKKFYFLTDFSVDW